MASAKKMCYLLITDLTPTPTPEGVVADRSQTIIPSPSEQVALSGSETIAPSSSESNAPAASESCEASPFETNPLSRQSQPSSAGASSSKSVQGPTVGKAIAKRVANNNGNKLYIPITETFNAFEGVLATPESNEIGLQIRRMCPIQGVNSWTVANPATKVAIVQVVQV
ncbi:uncharacterized protein LOC114290318 [Camellia sinensis]|uniref:uncharacterized protein LOC114290318 n=1 Tax=Camellia sinensis TaxID=4442 RepID=UPI001036CB41|nr:uncharacterized protein LOC114290318 [Camellia sinensis]